MSDLLQKFIFEKQSIRGECVVLDSAWQDIHARHDYPPAVMHLLGELSAACLLLSASLKFEGSLIMQIHGDGPVRLLVVECDAALQIRATAKLQAGVNLDAGAGLNDLVNQNGHGQFVITLVPKDQAAGMKPYQGVVSLGGESIAKVIENYMSTSEQLDTRLWLAADAASCRGFLLQKLPQDDEMVVASDAYWEHVVTLAATLSSAELLAIDAQTLLHRLYWEEDVRVFEPLVPTFSCSCTREKVAGMLTLLGKPEVDAALAELGEIKVNCDFCGQEYRFDAVDCAPLFLDPKSDSLVSKGNATRH